jgi:hypothetical protein
MQKRGGSPRQALLRKSRSNQSMARLEPGSLAHLDVEQLYPTMVSPEHFTGIES